MGTSVMPTHPAMTRAATAEVVAIASWPSSAAAPEYSASRSAAASAVIDRRKARTAEWPALARSREMVGSPLTALQSQRNGIGLDDIAKNGIHGFRLFLTAGVPRTG